MATQTQITRRVGKIVEILEEVRDQGHEMDLVKTAVEIESLYQDNEICPVCGTHKRNYFEMMGRTCKEEFHPDKEG